jgi:hypothetical protein
MELTVVNAQNAVQIFTGGGLDAILAGIEGQVRAMTLDGSTSDGRDKIRSVAYKVARTKTALDSEAKKLTEGWRTATGQVNAERKRAQERLDALAEEVRAPLTAFESKEKNRTAAHEVALAEMTIFSSIQSQATAEELEEAVLKFAGLHQGRDWEEFAFRANRQRVEIGAYLDKRLADRKQFDADQAELARLRKAEAERMVREHEQRLKTEAAETARLEEQRKAKEASDAEARRVIEAARKEQERVAAEAERVRVENERAQKQAEAARKSEQDARELAERRVIEQAEAAKKEQARLVEFAEKARAKAALDLKAAQAKAAEDLKAANLKAKSDAEAAVAKEKARVEALRKDLAEAQAKREADQKNRAQVRREIDADLESVFSGLGLDCLAAGAIADAIMDGKVRHVRVIF